MEGVPPGVEAAVPSVGGVKSIGFEAMCVAIWRTPSAVDSVRVVMAASVASFAARASEAARVCSRVLED